MSFVRPAVRAQIRRWREALVGLGVVALGSYWAFATRPGLLQWVGYVALAAGAILIVTGVQKGRFRHGGGGPGVVQIVERRIGYFGPLDGGLVDLGAITALSFDGTARPPHWVIAHDAGPPLHIPTNAEGADSLFDAFASLPGINPGRLASISQRQEAHEIIIWRRPDLRERTLRLH
jgi:hypothetical protein